MSLSEYHKKYMAKPDEELQRRADVKEEELRRIFEKIDFRPTNDPVRVFVVGCGEKRFVGHHKRIFSGLLGKEVDLVTSDITIEHLEGEMGIVQHDALQLFPGAPYDITYAHVFLKFIETEKQWDVLMHSWNALREGGLAIHVMDEEEVIATTETLEDGLFAVPLKRWEKQLSEEGIAYEVVEWTIEGIAPVPMKGCALILKK